MSEPAEDTEPPAVLEPEHLEGGGDDHLLLFVIWRGNSLEALKTLQGCLSTLGLVGDHSSDAPYVLYILISPELSK